MAARKRSGRKGTVTRTVESSVKELKKSLESLQRLLEGYLPSGSRGRRSTRSSRPTTMRARKRTSAGRTRRSTRST